MKTTVLLYAFLILSCLSLKAQKLAVYATGAGQRVNYNLRTIDAGGLSINPGSGYGGRLGLSLGIPVNFFGKEPGEVVIGLGIDQQRGLAISGTKTSVVDTAGVPDRIVSVTHVLQGRNAQVLEVGARGGSFIKGVKLQTSVILYRWGREMSTSAYRSLNLDGEPLGSDFSEPLRVLLPEQRANNSNPLFSDDKRPDNPGFSLSLGIAYSYELGKGVEVFMASEIGVTNSLDRDYYELPGSRLRFESFRLGLRGRLF
ncbi:hypothetical protein [Lewinella sp. W8]|uniref:hypothetical protein n=1 Tax=Lewinella sp. W8 TaxID=2528208 RepID=UPI00106833DC|nr:hypothetical protein [Lewinella sp. W8]MTB51650.1 hypothetical protein [Lewinella sp. W8]